MIPRILPLLLILCATLLRPAPAMAQEAWKEEARKLFETYRNAMAGRNYSEFLQSCETESRNLFRQLTLYHMDQLSHEELMAVLPRDPGGNPVPLKVLAEMSDAEFWTFYTASMRMREKEAEKMIKETRKGQEVPDHRLVSVLRDGNQIYLIVERVYSKPSPVPVPLTVLEVVWQDDRWKLKMPRELVWDAMDQARVQAAARIAEAKKAREESLKRPANVRPPLKPEDELPLPEEEEDQSE